MQKKISILLLASCLMFLFMGCNKDTPNESSSYEKGIDALHVEELPEAKTHFEATVKDEDKDQEQAEEYLAYIESAEDMQDALSEEKYDQALEIYTSIKEDEKFSSIQFMLSKDQDDLEKVMAKRGEIDGEIKLLTDLASTNQAENFIQAQLKELLDNKYLSKDQKKAIKELQDDEDTDDSNDEKQAATEDESKDVNDETEEVSPDNDEAENNVTDDGNQNENEENNNNDDEVENSDSESNLSEEDAESLVYEYVKENEVVSIELLEENVVVLNMDHKTEDGNYVFQLYEVKNDGDSGHTATYGWYEINVETKEIEEII